MAGPVQALSLGGRSFLGPTQYPLRPAALPPCRSAASLPQLLVNGPGTCIPICVATALARCAGAPQREQQGVCAVALPGHAPQQGVGRQTMLFACAAEPRGSRMAAPAAWRHLASCARCARCARCGLRRALGLARGRVVYVESIARVYRLSLTGKLLYHLRLTDRSARGPRPAQAFGLSRFCSWLLRVFGLSPRLLLSLARQEACGWGP